ncbi:hypothetical protein [Alteribacillus sp. HJP-4]|uniref:hypothetical protein n=1 Tax=Alteribacillus sp. HJP-4 TaxID=2775394 RepID=UPI0035CD26C9
MSNSAIDILVNATDNASSTLQNVGSSVDGMKGAMERAAGASKVLLGMVTGAVAGTVALGGRAVMQLAEIERISAQTDAVIKSTGGVANVTASDIDTMAVGMQYLTSVEHEAIRTGANMLLTFTNIRNEAGKGNDVFDRTTGLMTDLSVAMGIDTKSAATMLGKALNDPTQGMTALSRVGVSFTDEQKEQVKALQESGDMLGAQKLILGELETQYGGSAEALGGTFVGQLTMAKMAFDDVFQAIMSQLDALSWLTNGVSSAKDALLALGDSIIKNGIAGAFRELVPPSVRAMIMAVAGAITGGLVPAFYKYGSAIIKAVSSLSPFLKIGALIGLLAYSIMSNWSTFAPYFEGIFNTLKSTFETVKNALQTGWTMLVNTWNANKPHVFELLKQLWTTLQTAWGVLSNLLMSGWNMLVSAWQSRGEAASGIFTKLQNVWNMLQTAFQIAVPILISVFQMIAQNAQLLWESMSPVFEQIKTIFGQVVEFAKMLWNAIKPLVVIIGVALAAAVVVAIGIINGLIRAFSAIVAAILAAIQFILNLGMAIMSVFRGDWGAAMDYAKAAMKNLVQIVGNLLNAIVQFFVGFAQGVWSVIRPFAVQLWNTFKDAMSKAGEAVSNGVTKVVNFFRELPSKIMNFIKNLASKLSNGFQTMMRVAETKVKVGIAAVINFFGNLVSKVVNFITTLASNISSKFSSMMSKAKSLVKSGTTAVINFFKALPGKVMNFITNLASNLASKFTSMMDKAKSLVRSGIEAVVGFFRNLPGKVMNFITSLASKLSSKFTSMMSKAKDAVKTGVQNIITAIKNFGSKFLKAGKGLLDSLTKGIKDGIGKAKDAVKGGMEKIRSFLPFSPAKEGPLSDLDKSGESFFPTFAKGMSKKVNPMLKMAEKSFGELNDIMSQPASEMEKLNSFSFGRSSITVTHRHEHGGSIDVQGNGSKEAVRVAARSVETETQASIFRDLRQAIRAR